MNQDNFICNGQYRKNQNDSMEVPLAGCVSTKSPSVFGVFDGMGGEECGEIASFIAAQSASNIRIGKDVIEEVAKYCLDANAEICKYAQENSIASMGTTAAMLVFASAEIVLCNLGDSKVFRFSEGVIEQISHDHVSIAAYGVKPPLLQNLGIPPTELVIEPYLARGQYKNGDIYLICSDGLTDMVELDEIKDTLCNTVFDKITQELLNRALAGGGRDNISMIVCKIERRAGWLKRCLIRK